MSKAISGNIYEKKGMLVPIRWSSPEVLQFSKFSTKGDVWSFGIVLFEIVTRGARMFFFFL
jgi:serine/threonine protein kinase